MEREKDLFYYVKILKRRWVVLVTIPLIAALISGIISYFFSSKPVYLATTSLVMGTPNESIQETDRIDLDTILASPRLAKIFEPVVKSRNVEEKVINQLHLPLSVSQLNSKVSVNSMEDSDIITIHVIDNDAKLAADIANALAENFTQVVIEIKKVKTVSILDKAVAPDAPITSNNNQNILYAFLIGLISAFGLVLLMDYFDDSIKDSEDIQEILELPVIGMIPYDSEVTRREVESSLEISRLWILFNSKSPVVEAYRRLRTNIQFFNSEKAMKRILITSTEAGEGKSMMTVNLAISLAITGMRVLIIDANLREPFQHKMFELTNDEGLSNTLISGIPSLENVVHTLRGLDVLVSGPIPSNPSELLASNNMKFLLDDAQAAYDVVIIDSPPILATTDVSILAHAVDGVILVVGSREITRGSALEAKEQLKKVKPKIIGVVLNKVILEESKYRKKKRFKLSKHWSPNREIDIYS